MDKQLNRKGRRILIAVAKVGRTISYKALGRKLGIHWRGYTMRHLLGEISLAEHKAGRPLLSAVVVHTHNRKPGPGFIHGLCDRLTGVTLDWKYQLGRVHGYWQR